MLGESKRKLLWIFVGLVLATISLTLQFSNSGNLLSQYIVAAIPYAIALLPFLEGYFKGRKRESRVKDKIKEIKSFLRKHFITPIRDPDLSGYDLSTLSDEEIYVETIKHNFGNLKTHEIYSLLLCFYCSKYKSNENEVNPEIYDRIQKISNAMELGVHELNDKVKTFLKFYQALILSEENKYASIREITSREFDEEYYRALLKDYIKNFQKDLIFQDIKEKLHQSENLRQTLIRLIKEGRLSSWGVTKESLKKLEEELRKKTSYSKVFLVIGNKIRVKRKLKEYLESQPRLRGVLTAVNTPFNREKFSAYIVRPNERFDDPRKFLEKIKKLGVADDKETVIFVIPLDIINSEYYTLPYDQSFTSKHLQECFSIMRLFTYGYESQFADADIWSIISKSTITPEELLSVLPFNILCEGILTSEQEYFIRHYEKIKEKCGIKSITDWGVVKPEIIVNYLLEEGYPDYTNVEKQYLLKNYSEDFEVAVKRRLLELCQQIVNNAAELRKSLDASLISL